MTEQQREAAQKLASGHSQNEVAVSLGVAQSTISRWCDKDDFNALVARISTAVMEQAVRAAAHNIAEGVTELCAIRRKLAAGLNVQSDAPLTIIDAPAVKEHRETVKALNDISLSVQKNARENESHALSTRSERITIATALHTAKTSNIPTDPDEVEAKP